MKSQTGILFFSRLPQHDALVKSVSACREKNARILRHLYRATLKVSRQSNLPLIICHDEQQTGKTFSEKITNAIQNSFAKGFTNLIIIGSDCPGIKTEDILNAAQYLKNGGQMVAGPDNRGGVYLLGINRDIFNKDRFLNFRWQTEFLLNDVCNYAKNFEFAICTDKLADVHNLDDVIASLSTSRSMTCWRLLVNNLFVFILATYYEVYSFIKNYLSIRSLSLRAPPVVYCC